MSGRPYRFSCCVCGRRTEDAFDYVVVTLELDDDSPTTQHLGAHAACLESVFANGSPFLWWVS